MLIEFMKTEETLLDAHVGGDLYAFTGSGFIGDVFWEQIFSNRHTVSLWRFRRFSGDLQPIFLQLLSFVEFHSQTKIFFVASKYVLWNS